MADPDSISIPGNKSDVHSSTESDSGLGLDLDGTAPELSSSPPDHAATEASSLGPTTPSSGSPRLSRNPSFSGSNSYLEDWEGFTPLDRLGVMDLLDNFALPQQLERLQRRLSAQTQKVRQSRDVLKSQSQKARERMVEEWSRRVPSAEEQLERYRKRMRTSVDKLGKQWHDRKVITLREKVSFICGVLNIFVSGYLLGAYPEWMHLWYSVQILYFMPIRYFTYHKLGYHYFLADLCYFVNFMLMLSIWASLAWSTIPYAVWQLSYYFFITVRRRDKIAAGRPTSYTWLRKSYAKSWIGKLVLSLPESLQGVAFMLIQYGYAVLTMLPCPIWFYSRWASATFLMVVFVWSVYNGATYYIDVFGKRFQKELEELKAEVAKWHNSPDGSGSPQMTPHTGDSPSQVMVGKEAGESAHAEALGNVDSIPLLNEEKTAPRGRSSGIDIDGGAKDVARERKVEETHS